MIDRRPTTILKGKESIKSTNLKLGMIRSDSDFKEPNSPKSSKMLEKGYLDKE